jgi:hypothetical protein
MKSESLPRTSFLQFLGAAGHLVDGKPAAPRLWVPVLVCEGIRGADGRTGWWTNCVGSGPTP